MIRVAATSTACEFFFIVCFFSFLFVFLADRRFELPAYLMGNKRATKNA
jgi:hypothetical protein